MLKRTELLIQPSTSVILAVVQCNSYELYQMLQELARTLQQFSVYYAASYV